MSTTSVDAVRTQILPSCNSTVHDGGCINEGGSHFIPNKSPMNTDPTDGTMRKQCYLLLTEELLRGEAHSLIMRREGHPPIQPDEDISDLTEQLLQSRVDATTGNDAGFTLSIVAPLDCGTGSPKCSGGGENSPCSLGSLKPYWWVVTTANGEKTGLCDYHNYARLIKELRLQQEKRELETEMLKSFQVKRG